GTLGTEWSCFQYFRGADIPDWRNFRTLTRCESSWENLGGSNRELGTRGRNRGSLRARAIFHNAIGYTNGLVRPFRPFRCSHAIVPDPDSNAPSSPSPQWT